MRDYVANEFGVAAGPFASSTQTVVRNVAGPAPAGGAG